MKEILGHKVEDEYFDYLFCEQTKGKELKVVDGKVVAVEHEVTQEEIINDLRTQRETECFSIINRGKLWYDNLTEEQLIELQTWYKAWLDVTETKVVPEKPSWLNSKGYITYLHGNQENTENTVDENIFV